MYAYFGFASLSYVHAAVVKLRKSHIGLLARRELSTPCVVNAATIAF